MKKFMEVFRMLAKASRISIVFCLKAARFETITRVCLAVIASALSYLSVVALGNLLSAVQVSRPSSLQDLLVGNVGLAVGAMVAMSIMGGFTQVLNWFFAGRWKTILQQRNTMDLHRHRATLDVATINSKQHDDLVHRVQDLPSGWQTRVYFSEDVLALLRNTCTFVTFGLVLAHTNAWYVLTIVLATIPFLVTEFLAVNRTWKLNQEMIPDNKVRHINERPFTESTQYTQAKTFGQHSSLKQVVQKMYDDKFRRQTSNRITTAWQESLAYLFTNTMFGLVLLHIVWVHIQQGVDVGKLSVLIASASSFSGSLVGFVELITQQWNSARGVVLIQEEYLGLKPAVVTSNPVIPVFNGPPRIVIRDVCFAYPEQDVLALKNVSLTIEPGAKVAIVGKSGHGKTTLAHLLLRHYDPSAGHIEVGDHKLTSIEPSEWVNTIGMLHQDFSVAPRRLDVEIASSRMDKPVDMGRVERAACLADLTDMVRSEEHGFMTQIGTEFGGKDFSGGERQRIALARLHYRGVPVMVFDEPDAKLDPESAQKVMDYIFSLQGVTVIIITHHVSRTQRCDHVAVMEKGEIVEQGNPRELLARDGHYDRLVKADQKRLICADD